MIIHIRIVEATDVPKMDLIGSSDPYCKISLSGNYEAKTKVRENTLKPVWNEEFHFNVGNSVSDKVIIKMFDKDSIGKDDPISVFEMSVSEIPKGKLIEKWYDMQPVDGVKVGGRIRLVLHLGNIGDLPFKPQK